MAMSSEYPSGPLPFIMTDNSERFFVEQETAQVLGRIQKPVVVVAIIGKYRTGKSFLMNQLAANPAIQREKAPSLLPERSERESSSHCSEESDDKLLNVKSLVKKWTVAASERESSSHCNEESDDELLNVKSLVKKWTVPARGSYVQKPSWSSPVVQKRVQDAGKVASISLSGFSVGNTLQSHTKGIWVWPVPHPHDDSNCLLLLDIEGLGDVEKANDEHDTWLFVMALLLSNILVYNTVGTLDHGSLEQLQYVKDVAAIVKAKNTSDKTGPNDLDKYIPSLIVCVRDFTLKLELHGNPCTADEYMDHCFNQRKEEKKKKKGKKEAIKTFNEGRELMCRYFQKRKCFMFPMPANPEHLRTMDTIPVSDFNPHFLRATNELKTHILKETKYKNIDGVILTGQLFLKIAELYVQAQHSEGVVCIENARVQIVQLANMQAMEDAKVLYDEEMQSITNSFPTSIGQLQTHHEKCMEKAMQHFYSRSVFDEKHTHNTELMEYMDTLAKKLKTQNTKLSEEKCKKRLKELYSSVDQNIQGLMRPGIYNRYQDLMKKFEEDYKKTAGLGDEKMTVYMDFLEQKNERAQNILMMDKALTNVEKKEIEFKAKEKLLDLKMQSITEEHDKQKKEISFFKQQNEKLFAMFDSSIKLISKRTDEDTDEMKKKYKEKLSDTETKKNCIIS